MQNTSLKSKATKGMLWNAVEKFSVQGMQFVIGIILARLLLPADYGLIGMLAIFLALSQLFIDSGFSKALIQKKNRTDVDYSTVFYFNIVVSAALYLILYLAAPFIAGFYEEPELVSLTRVLAISIPLSAFTVVQRAKLTIKLDFKSIAKIQFVAVFISGTVGIVMAYQGFGVWALVLQAIIRVVVVSILFWYFGKWKPGLVFSKSSFKQLFSFGSKLLGAGLIATVFQNIYYILIGKIFSAKELGYYTRAVQFTNLVSGTVTSIIQTVTFPILTSLQDDKKRLVSTYRKLIRLTTMFIFPVMALMALLAEPFIRFFLTEKWMPVVPLMQWLALARVFTPISSLNMNILNAVGRSDLFLKLDILKIPIMLVALAVTLPIGVKAVVIGQVISSFIAFFINAYYPGKFFSYGALQQIKDMKLILLATFIMAVFVFLTVGFFSSDVAKLIVGSFTGIVVYYLSVVLFKLPEMKEIHGLVKENYLSFRKKR